MDVRETTLQELLGGPKQYVVPIYQRPYAWEARQRGRLWDDVMALAAARRTRPGATHFMGSIVLSAGEVVPAGMEFLVVDGQQRLTTLTLVLCALRDALRDCAPLAADGIHEQYVSDRFRGGESGLRVLPTDADRDPFRAVVDGAPTEPSTIADAADFFREQVARLSDDDVAAVRGAVLAGLTFVTITAREPDNVYRIFESLNNTGLRLTQGDLVRNALFMRLGSRGADVYRSWWLPMQQRLSAEDLELLFWLDAVAEEPLLKQTDVYAHQQVRFARMSVDDIAAEVERFGRLATLLEVIRDPGLEPDPAVRLRLAHLADWGSTTTVPLTLRLLALRAARRCSSAEVAAALLAVESYLVRRVLIGKVGAGVNRTILQACGVLDEGPVDRAVREFLSTGRKHFATDTAVRDAVLTSAFYLRGSRAQQKLVLAWIQEALNPREPVVLDRVTIEHIRPQNPGAAWDVAPPGHEDLVHTLRNLTLTGYNSSLGNRSFAAKQTALAQGTFGALHGPVLTATTWSAAAIRDRGAWLASVITAIWVGPSPSAGSAAARWVRLHAAITAIPTGRWTSYGDLAALVGTHPVAVGMHIAGTDIPGAHRVLRASGAISPGARWIAADGRDARAVLEAEGVVFSAAGLAGQGQRVGGAELRTGGAVRAGTAPPVR